MFNQLTPFHRKLISAAVAILSVTVVFLFVLYPARLEGSSKTSYRDPNLHGDGGRTGDDSEEVQNREPQSLENLNQEPQIRGGHNTDETPQSHDRGMPGKAETRSMNEPVDSRSPREGASRVSEGNAPNALAYGIGGEGGPDTTDSPSLNRLGVGDRVLVGILIDKRTGRLLEDASFSVEAFSQKDWHSPVPAELSSSQGKFVLSGLSAGEYEVLVQADGYAPLRSRVAIPAAREIRFELDTSGMVRIRVTDAYARRLEPERIRLIDDDGGDPEQRLSRSFENGYQVVTGLSDGIHSLQIEVPGYAPHKLEALVDPEEPRSYWVIVE